MPISVVYFNSSCGVKEFAKLDYAFRSDLKVFVGDEEVKVEDAQDLSDALSNKKDIPRTSQPSTIEIKEVYEQALKDHDNVIVITPSKYLSGTHQNAVLASEGFAEGQINIVESKSFALSEYILVKEFIKLREEYSLGEIISKLNALAKKYKTYIIPGTFDYLKHSGRVSAPKALVASFLKIKVIVRHVEPDVIETDSEVAEIYYQGRGLNGMFKEISNLFKDPKAKKVYYSSIVADPAQSEQIFKLAKEANLELEDVGMASQIIYSHFGPKSFGFCIVYDD